MPQACGLFFAWVVVSFEPDPIQAVHVLDQGSEVVKSSTTAIGVVVPTILVDKRCLT